SGALSCHNLFAALPRRFPDRKDLCRLSSAIIAQLDLAGKDRRLLSVLAKPPNNVLEIISRWSPRGSYSPASKLRHRNESLGHNVFTDESSSSLLLRLNWLRCLRRCCLTLRLCTGCVANLTFFVLVLADRIASAVVLCSHL